MPQVASACDLCDGSSFETISRLDRRGNPLETVVCTTCGLVAHARIPTEADLEHYYAAEYRRDYHGEVTPSARRVVRAWRNGERLVRQLSDYFSPGDRVFEVGAGIGCTVKAFELAGCDAAGIDPGAGFQRFARQRLLARVERQSLFDVTPAGMYDLVLLVHVIEHFSSPRRALEHLCELVRPGGRVYVECPNLSAPFARYTRMFHFAHVHNFTPRTLAMLAGRCGFHVERQFSDRDDPNLQMLLVRRGTARLSIDRDSYDYTLSALRQAGSAAYHLRRRYLAARIRKLAGYVEEHLTARYRLRQILARCAESTAAAGRAPRRAA
ncbi:MAG: class I SAM-dependent methyltransferase [Pirellulales bacterium]